MHDLREGLLAIGTRRLVSFLFTSATRPPHPSDPEADLRGQPTTTPRRPDPTPWPKTESRRVTLECQTLKDVRELVRRSFVTDLPEFRHICIRQSVGSVTRATDGT